MKIVKFEWDHSKGEPENGKSLIIGQHLPKQENAELSHVEVYGVSLDIVDDDKDLQLKKLSCFSGNICGEVTEVTREEARNLFMLEVDRILDVLFNVGNQKEINETLNIYEDMLIEEDE